MVGGTVKWIGIIIVIVIVSAVVALVVAPGKIIRTAVEKGGSMALGVPVHLKGAELTLLGGAIDLKGLEIGNPPGYMAKNAVEVGRINVQAPLSRLIRSNPRIESITIEAPAVTLEQALTRCNLSDLLGNKGASGQSGGGTKMIIGRLSIVNAKVSVVPKIKGVSPSVINLPLIELQELGAEKKAGVTIAQTVALSLREIVKSAVANGGGVIPSDLSASLSSSAASIDQTGRQIAEAVSDTRKQAVGSAAAAAKGLMEKVTGAVK